LWCSPVASSMASVCPWGCSVMAAARLSSSSVASPIAETTTTRSAPAARSRAIRLATRRIRSASARLEPPNFCTTSGAGIAAFYPGVPALPAARRTRTGKDPSRHHEPCPVSADCPAGDAAMCFDHDSRPPIVPIAGGALDSLELTLTAADGNRMTAFEARAAEPTDTSIVILPAVRGLHDYYAELGMLFPENGIDALAFDWFGRTAGLGRRAEGFDHMTLVSQLNWDGMAADIAAAAAHARSFGRGSLFTIGFCMGGRGAFLTPTLGLGLTGAIGFYGSPRGQGGRGAPAPRRARARAG